MKILITILIVVFICSCSRTVGQAQLKSAIGFCKDKEGVFSLKIMDTNEVFITCKDGTSKQIDR